MSSRIRQRVDNVKTEEATKTALVMPFINHVLGYNVFDPAEVVPEFITDVGTKKGEKKLKSALASTDHDESAVPTETAAEDTAGTSTADTGIVTTEEEWQAFYAVTAILSEEVSPDRVVIRDGKSLCAILLDNTNRQPSCRLYFNKAQKKIGLLNEQKCVSWPANRYYNWQASSKGDCQCHADAHWHRSRSPTNSKINSTGLPARPPCPTPWSSGLASFSPAPKA